MSMRIYTYVGYEVNYQTCVNNKARMRSAMGAKDDLLLYDGIFQQARLVVAFI